MDGWSGRSLTPEFRRFAPLFAALDGPILDVPCGYGRHALSLHELGCRITCADIDHKALEDLAFLNRGFTKAGQKPLELFEADLVNGPWPFQESQFAGALNVHFYDDKLLCRITNALVSGGLFYIETIANRKGNYTQLPRVGEVPELLTGAFEFLYLRENSAGPGGSGRVTVRMLARKI